MRLVAVMLAAGMLAGCQAPQVASGPVPERREHTRRMIEGDNPPVPRSDAERNLFVRARLIGMEHGTARAAVNCTATVDRAQTYLRLQQQRERAMTDMRDRAPDLLHIAAQASAGTVVLLRNARQNGCDVARRNSLEAAERDPWNGYYGVPLQR